MVSSLYICICICVCAYINVYILHTYTVYIYTFSNLADTFIQCDLQMRTMEIYVLCVCFVFLQIWFILTQYSHRFSISCAIGYKSACFLYFIQVFFLFFFITFIEVIFSLISLTFISNSYIRSINSIIIMWLLLSIRYQIKSFTLKNTTTLNYEILKKKLNI